MAPKRYIAESLTLLTSAFGLVAALAWNEAIKKLIEQVVPKGAGLLSLFIYALAVTIVAVFVTSRLIRIKERFDEKKN